MSDGRTSSTFSFPFPLERTISNQAAMCSPCALDLQRTSPIDQVSRRLRSIAGGCWKTIHILIMIGGRAGRAHMLVTNVDWTMHKRDSSISWFTSSVSTKDGGFLDSFGLRNGQERQTGKPPSAYPHCASLQLGELHARGFPSHKHTF